MFLSLLLKMLAALGFVVLVLSIYWTVELYVCLNAD